MRQRRALESKLRNSASGGPTRGAQRRAAKAKTGLESVSKGAALIFPQASRERYCRSP